jgi:hypothetical protein
MTAAERDRRRWGWTAAVLYGLFVLLLFLPTHESAVGHGVPAESCGAPIRGWTWDPGSECQARSLRRLSVAAMLLVVELPFVVRYVAAAVAAGPRADDD